MKKEKFHLSTQILLPALILLYSFTGHSTGSPADRSAERTGNGGDTLSEVLQRVAMQVKEAFIRGDSALFLKTFTADGCILAPNAPSLCGKQGLVRFYQNTRKAGIGDTQFTSLGLYGQTADYVTEQGVFEVFDPAGHSINKGKMLNIWKKTAQGWRIFRQMLNFDAPMAAPGPSK